MGMLLGSLIGVQIGSLVTKVVPGIMIRGFFRPGRFGRIHQPFLCAARKITGTRLHPDLKEYRQHTQYCRKHLVFCCHRMLRHLGVLGIFLKPQESQKGENLT